MAIAIPIGMSSMAANWSIKNTVQTHVAAYNKAISRKHAHVG